MKKLFAALLALVMALSLTTLAFAAEIVPPTDPVERAVIIIPVEKTITKAGPATDFAVELLNQANGQPLAMEGVTTTSITTNGSQQTGDHQIVITVVGQGAHHCFSDGIYIREVARTDGWECDEQIWFMRLEDTAREDSVVTNDAINYQTKTFDVKDIQHVTVDSEGELVYAETTWDEGDYKYFDKVSFTNTYTKSSTPRYYYNSTTTTTEPASSPKTFDAGIALYAALSLTSLTGMAALGRKKF